MLTSKKVSITIPAFNEEKTIEQVTLNALLSISKLAKDYEILLINDGSNDKTGKIIDSLKRKYKDKIRVINHAKNLGFSGAMKSCYENANGDYIFLGPADGQFDYSQIELFLEKIPESDIVVAFRVKNEESIRRKVNSFFFHLVAKVLFGIPLKEFSSCILYSKTVRNSIKINAASNSCLFLPELMYKAMEKKFKFAQVPINFYKRKGGVAKGSHIKMILETLSEMLRFWFEIKTGKIANELYEKKES